MGHLATEETHRRARTTDTRATRYRCLPIASTVRSTYPAHATPTYLSVDTCIHYHSEERCTHQKPLHDTVCAIRKPDTFPLTRARNSTCSCTDVRCPVINCTQARAQVLETNSDPLSNGVPRYARFDVCSARASQTQLAAESR
jgi:hypothetical protein